MSKIGILGAGTWGIALARLLSVSGHDVIVWSAINEEIEELSRKRTHPKLPNMRIPEAVVFAKEIKNACAGADVILIAVPSVYVRSTAKLIRPYCEDGQIIVNVAKGIEAESLLTLTDVICDELKQGENSADVRLVALSGPTHAEEVAQDQPTTIVSACTDMYTAEAVQNIFSNDVMRVYTNTDVLGVELCGALKNVIALAVGISDGLGYGDNTKAALMTRGMAEITRLGVKMGCVEQTFYGLAGMGDLIVTSTSKHSRNNRAGYLIGRGHTPKEAVELVGMVVEGINVLPAAMQLAKIHEIELPIIETVNRIVSEGRDPAQSVGELMGRKRKAEFTKR